MKDFHATPKFELCQMMHFKPEAKKFFQKSEILAQNDSEYPEIKNGLDLDLLSPNPHESKSKHHLRYKVTCKRSSVIFCVFKGLN